MNKRTCEPANTRVQKQSLKNTRSPFFRLWLTLFACERRWTETARASTEVRCNLDEKSFYKTGFLTKFITNFLVLPMSDLQTLSKFMNGEYNDTKESFVRLLSPNRNKTGTSQVGAISYAQKYSRNNYCKNLEKKIFKKIIFEI